jgi:ACS family hexuronate transporter-like MFS transporter
LSFAQCFRFKQTWAFAFGKFMTDGVWWFYLFWMPKYLQPVFHLEGTDQVLPLTVLYTIVMISIYGGWLPSYFIGKKGMNPYAGRMRSMLIFAFFPLLALFAQPLGGYSYWLPVIIIGIAAAAHQAWSANIFSTVGDMFPKTAIATITGIGGMAGGLGSFFIQKGAGKLFDYTGRTKMSFLGFEGEPSGYFMIFIFCAIAYLIGWIVMKSLVPKYKPVII